ncbi:MAG TPA: DUF4136 domain-containing protein [Vicinamibacterales bacterium]
MRRLIGLTSAFLFVVAAAAAAQDVSYNFDQQADFTKYKTYRWVESKGGEQLDPLITKQIVDAFDLNLATKGLTKATGDTADLLVSYQVALNQEKQMTTFDSGYGMGAGWGPRYYGGYYGGGGITTSTTSTIYVGSVALEMYDAPAKKLVWRGIASKQVDTKAKPEKRTKNLNKGAAKMLKNYPPKVKT